MSLKNIRLAKSALDDNIYVGYIDKSGIGWEDKKDITGDFLGAVISRWNGFKEKIKCGDKLYEISVKEISLTQRATDGEH